MALVYFEKQKAIVSIMPTQDCSALKVYIRNVGSRTIIINHPRSRDLNCTFTLKKRLDRDVKDTRAIYESPIMTRYRVPLQIKRNAISCTVLFPSTDGYASGLYKLLVTYEDGYIDDYSIKAGISDYVGISKTYSFLCRLTDGKISELKKLNEEK